MLTPRWTRDGGVAAHVQVSAAALAQHGLQVAVAAAKIDDGTDVPGVSVHHAPQLFDSRASARSRIGEALSLEPDVIHVHQADDPDLVAGARSLAPVVTSAHGYTACTPGVYYFRPGEECTRGHGVGCIPNLVARGCAHARHPKTLPVKFRNAGRGRAALERSDLVVSYSSAVDRHLANNGLHSRAVVPYFPTMPAKHGSGHESRRRVVFAGRIVPTKGVDVLIRAAALVESAEFVLCGDGREGAAMRELARELGVSDRVEFKGWLDPDALASELADASFVVMPSIWPEPFGLVGIEGFAAGRPAIASGTGGIVDWLEDGVSGLAVAPADVEALARAMVDLLADPDRQARMGQAGKAAVAERFSPERHVAALLDGYRAARSRWQAAAPAAS
jgi:glycosyltransferase involved in cell wall biosynthesis